MISSLSGLPLAELQQHVDEHRALEALDGAREADLDAFTQLTECKEYPFKVIVDCTASDEVAERYPHWLEKGFHVITPSRQVLIGPYQRYEESLKHVGGAKLGASQLRYDAAATRTGP